MASVRIGNSIAVAVCFSSLAAAQDQAETCYGPGSVVGAVVGTLIVTLGLLASGFFLYNMYWKNRKGKHLVLMTDAENPHDQYAFDNPCFREASPIKHNFKDEKQSSKLNKTKWPGWPPVHTFGREHLCEKITSMDDSYVNNSRLKVVTLKSHDFTGLGFNICGNMRDGIFVKDVLHRGPAFESGCINAGDRIDSVCISFRNMVFEDALTILSYASPYDVQVQVENDSHSRPSTLMRNKRESNVVNSSDRILHPKFNRSQSVSHLSEIGKNSNKKLSHQIGFMLDKNRINHSLNKSHDFSDSTIKASTPLGDSKTHKSVTPKISHPVGNEKSPKVDNRDKEFESQQTKLVDPQNKLQKFGIKVLPISINPKMGVHSMTGTKKPGKSLTSVDNEVNSAKEKPEKPEKLVKPKESSRSTSVEEKLSGIEEPDGSRENMKTVIAKGFLNLKEKINQNTLGKKKKGEGEGNGEETESNETSEETKQGKESDCPIPKLRSSVTCGVKAYEQNQQNHMNVPEEVSKAGDVARNNRKSIVEARNSIENLEPEEVIRTNKLELASDSEEYSDKESKDESKRPKKSKGKAPAPPKLPITSKEINEIKKEFELLKEETNIFEPDSKIILLKDEDETGRKSQPSYDSDSDTEPITTPKDILNTKIELNATQVTVHQIPTGDANDDDAEPNRKAASLGDLSKLDSDQPLSIVLERAVSLDLTENTSQCGKKRKAPLPPSEAFPAVFDDLNYRKEPRLEGLNTFQRRLKKSSDFGTLEDALCDGPKSLEIEVNKNSSLNLTETYNYNIQEFSSWLAECRRPKTAEEESKNNEEKHRLSSTSLININTSECVDEQNETEDKYEYQGLNVSFSVNGKNFRDFEISSSSENMNFPGTNSRTVVVISQPNSLEPAMLEKAPANGAPNEATNGTDESNESSEISDGDVTPPKLPTSPIPTSNTLSSPLSSTLTYITEIKVSTSEQDSQKSESKIPQPNSISERIQKFDSAKGFDSSPAKNHFMESSKIPIRTMKSETGQKVLATIQSLAKEVSPTKTPEVEYAKKMASLFSNPPKNAVNIRKSEIIENEILRPNISGLYLKTTPPKPSKDYSPTRKVPPVVPPRKFETSLTSKSAATMELPSPLSESQDKNIVTFSSFTRRNQIEDSGTPSKIFFQIKEHEEINGKEKNVMPVKTSATKIVFESKEKKDGL